MELLPTQDEVVNLLRESGGLRDGHFIYPNGMHSDDYLQVAITMRSFQHAKTLSVALSRLLRANTEIKAVIPKLSIVAPATGGLPVAYGVCEALRAKQVYWGEYERPGEPLAFRQFLEVQKGEKVIIVDDILRTGRKLSQLKSLIESRGGEVMGLAVMVYQPYPGCVDFSPLPLYYLAKLNPPYYPDSSTCPMCKAGEAPIQVLV